ncbi:hypothetical protein EHI8A_041570 [Entamoeba histolytica HM-1:IMSS-B]|uniref:Spatacsin C-terminal domain-containing protein n=6 Tax=Entamoeba histolytica TaxID=5759 RepID=C4LVB6_ENTH1|nr:hypothetical protein EHI_196980 [Entamoeba histolytica HM-1:IMSS]EMD42443.1 Hypothetical protein EHI5A_075560 [Entamoeba histolytica KU27]EMH73145.1 hypothetical protein EHI8A_041570 [Entamoeba histolytica HM-1:IMSS-B]EMS16216.1 hypothetical protein KM1_084820 [Entamoeba histolytica HM-3:IMSS]ENY63208.1 hypothetical protein EHI7A_051580 [Entamoeba histolytica HM-1:IMSS-A]EAL47752.2 hypothetical protein EHI_196980 [Entamoeba histolytica HM-1:IMSS]|eukprot:XP_653138.2 hypothetical protein EHI_196980 [Entamoeba histolytica HM-1:IMSS]
MTGIQQGQIIQIFKENKTITFEPYDEFEWFLFNGNEMIVLRKGGIISIADDKTPPSPLMKLNEFKDISIYSYKEIFVVIVKQSNTVECFIFHNLRQNRLKPLYNVKAITMKQNCLFVLKEDGELFCIDCFIEGKSMSYHFNLKDIGLKEQELEGNVQLEVKDNLLEYWIINNNGIRICQINGAIPFRQESFIEEMEHLYDPKDLQLIGENDENDDEYIPYSIQTYLQDYITLSIQYSNKPKGEWINMKNQIENVDIDNRIIQVITTNNKHQLINLNTHNTTMECENLLYLKGDKFKFIVIENTQTILYYIKSIDILHPLVVCGFDYIINQLKQLNNISINFTTKLLSSINRENDEDINECINQASYQELLDSINIIEQSIGTGDSLSIIVKRALELGTIIMKRIIKEDKTKIFDKKIQNFIRKIIDSKYPIRKRFNEENQEEKRYEKPIIQINNKISDIGKEQMIQMLYSLKIKEAIKMGLISGYENICEELEIIKQNTCNTLILKGCILALKECGIKVDELFMLFDKKVPSIGLFKEQHINVVECMKQIILRRKAIIAENENTRIELQKIKENKMNELNEIMEEKTQYLDELSENGNSSNNEITEKLNSMNLIIQTLQEDIEEIAKQIKLIIPLKIEALELPQLPEYYVNCKEELLCPLGYIEKNDLLDIMMEMRIIPLSKEFKNKHFPCVEYQKRSFEHFFTPTTSIEYIPFYELCLDHIKPLNEWMMEIEDINTKECIKFDEEELMKNVKNITSISNNENINIIDLYKIKYQYNPSGKYNISYQQIKPFEINTLPLKECIQNKDIITCFIYSYTNKKTNQLLEVLNNLPITTETIILEELLTHSYNKRKEQYKLPLNYPSHSSLLSDEFQVYGFFNNKQLPEQFYKDLFKRTIPEILYFFDMNQLDIPSNDESPQIYHLSITQNYHKEYPHLLDIWDSIPLEEYLKDFGIIGEVVSKYHLEKIPSQLFCEFIRCVYHRTSDIAKIKATIINKLITENPELTQPLKNIIEECSNILDTEDLLPLGEYCQMIKGLNKNSILIKAEIECIKQGINRNEIKTTKDIIQFLLEKNNKLLDELIILCNDDEQFYALFEKSYRKMQKSEITLYPINILNEMKGIKQNNNEMYIDTHTTQQWKLYIEEIKQFKGDKSYIIKHFKCCCELIHNHKECAVEQLCSILYLLYNELFQITLNQVYKLEAEKYNHTSFNDCLVVLGIDGHSYVKKVLRIAMNGSMTKDLFNLSSTKLGRMSVNVGSFNGQKNIFIEKESDRNEFTQAMENIKLYKHTSARIQLFHDIMRDFPIRRDIIDMALTNYNAAILKLFNQFLQKEFLEMLDNTEKWDALFKYIRVLKYVEMVEDESIIQLILLILFKASNEINLIKIHGWSTTLVNEIVGMFNDNKMIAREVLELMGNVHDLHLISELLVFVIYAARKSNDGISIKQAIKICVSHIDGFINNDVSDLIRLLSRTDTFNDVLINKENIYSYLLKKMIDGKLSFKNLVPNNDSKLNPVNIFFFSDALNQIIYENSLDVWLKNKNEIVDCFMYIQEFEQAAHFQYLVGITYIEKLVDQIKENTEFPEGMNEILSISLECFAGSLAFFSTTLNNVWANKCTKQILCIVLQMVYNNVQIIGLDPLESKELLCYFNNFEDANIFAQVYDLNETSKWAAALMQQCVIMGNLEYFKEWAECYEMDNRTYETLIEFMQTDKRLLNKERWEKLFDMINSIFPQMSKETRHEKTLVERIRQTPLKLHLYIQ